VLKNSKILFGVFFLVVSMGMLGASAFAQAAKTINIEGLDSLRFSVTHIEAKPGEKLTVNLTNKTSLPPAAMSHNFVLLKKGADPSAIANAGLQYKDNGYIPKNMADEIIAHTGLVSGGETKSVTFNAPKKPGDYTYICTFPGHYAAGMKGTLTVK
jgi:azurin